MPDAKTPEDERPWQRFLQEVLLGPDRLLGNAEISVSTIESSHGPVPLVTHARGDASCSWVASLRNAYGPYARAEVELLRLGSASKALLKLTSHLGETLVRAGGLSGGHYWNNWLFATNLYPESMRADDLLGVLDGLCSGENPLPVAVRSLTPRFHATFMTDLVAAGFLLLPSRQIWLIEDPKGGAWRRHRDSRSDLKHAAAFEASSEWIRGEDFSEADFDRALALYQHLYRGRYPIYNADYTRAFLKQGAATGLIQLHGLRPRGGGPLKGFIGMVHRGNTACTPLLGYDLSAPVAEGHYRLQALKATLEAEQRGQALHASAGAGAFKQSRGAEAHVEYTAVWVNHLPLYRRANVRALSGILERWAVPYLKTHRF